jgi:hypothetical protein
MKYASEVIDLMAAFPGREFRMAQIIRHVTGARNIPASERHAVREGVKRVLRQLCDSGQVEQAKDGETSAYYSWRCSLQYAHMENCKSNCNNAARTIGS